MTKNNQTYASAITELETILGDVENSEIDVDELILKIKRASTLVSFCKNKLRKTEEELDNIMNDLEER